ncbi:DUF4843 domain-containing protein [Sphingobacterium chungjuense]|uniref:DUF4843 domain-containing protein n=1 Tax=Sphingobacterium chungjuense TaxID=2675553 RepID=UPI00140B7950|nr:DUF4843 domain-containing protein [Sphingobacterium chungjuense]
MKNSIIIALCLLLTSCFKDYEDKLIFKDFMVEFQDAVVVSNAVGKTYPIITARPGEHKLQVNLLGGLSESAQTIRATVVASETTAVQGQHYELSQDGQIQFPANTAISSLNYAIPSLAPQTDVVLVIELQANDQVKTSGNYKTVGIRIQN